MSLQRFGLGKSPHHWGVVAKPKGKHKGIKLVSSVGVAHPTPDDALNFVRLRLARDVNFRKLYNGHQFLPVLLDHVVVVEGIVCTTLSLDDAETQSWA